MDEAYINLIEAIMRQASKDYRAAKKKLAMCPDDWKAQDLLKDVEGFVRADWFEMLADADGDRLLERMEHEWDT